MHKKVLSMAGYLTLASTVEKVGGFIITPILTLYLTTGQYGDLMIAISYAGFLSLMFYNGLQSSLFRWYSSWDEPWDKKLYEKSIFTIVVGAAVLLSTILVLINYVYPLESLLGINFWLLLLVLASNISLIPITLKSSVWVIDGRAYYNFVVSLFKTLVSVLLIWWFTKLYVSEYIKPLAEIASVLLIWCFFVWSFSTQYQGFREGPKKEIKSVLKKSFLYGWSVQISQLAYWVITSSDRVILGKLLGSTATAYFSIIMMGLAPIFVIISFNNSFSVAYNSMVTNGTNIRTINNILAKYLIYGSSSIFVYKLILYFFSDTIILILSNKEYLILSRYMHLTADILFLYYCYLLFTRYLHAKLKTKKIITVSTVAACVNVLGNYILIPLVGIKGSLYSSIFAYFVMAAVSLIFLFRDEGLRNAKFLSLVFLVCMGVYCMCDCLLLLT